MSVEEQQRLVEGRTERLLLSKAPPAEPPEKGLYQKRLKLRGIVDEGFAEQLAITANTPRTPTPRDDAARASKFAAVLRRTSGLDDEVQRFESRVTSRVLHRDSINLDAADNETARELKASHDIDERADTAIDRFLRADHVLKDPAVTERMDLDRERRVWDDARGLISSSTQMKDFDTMHIGEVPKVGAVRCDAIRYDYATATRRLR